jgi:hypothetical protein
MGFFMIKMIGRVGKVGTVGSLGIVSSWGSVGGGQNEKIINDNDDVVSIGLCECAKNPI